MKALFRYFGLLALLFFGMFLVQRHLFLAFNHEALHGISVRQILECHWKALPMDLSTTGYILLVACLFAVPLLFVEKRWLHKALRIYLIAVILFSALVNVSDIGLFGSWGVKLDRKALGYLRYPGEIAGVLAPGRFALLLLVAGVQSMFFIFLLNRLGPLPPCRTGAKGRRILAAVLLPALCVVALRGGPQDLPISKSWVWFSRYPVLNEAALNSDWNLLELAVQPAEFTSNPYTFMPTAEAEARFAANHPKAGAPSERILKNKRPNILLIMLESWTAGVIEPLGGDTGVTPQFTRLCREGQLFPHFYASGFRTEQGLCALLSGFPSQPTTTIIRKFGKFDQLPSLVRTLDSTGYSSRYYYAGDVSFANTRSYLDAMGFDKVYDETAFPIKRRTRWGAFDEELFNFHLRDAKTAHTPFFQIIMTATSHEPFDADVHEGFSGSDANLYRNTVHYTDRCLGAFLDSAKRQPWYANTLVVIVADHGNELPHHLPKYNAARHHIPFLITGGALREELRGTVNPVYANHADLAATLLGQLDLPHTQFPWSRDLYDRSVPHNAFWTYNNGFGMADSSQEVVWDNDAQRVIELRDSSRTGDEERLLQLGKAQLQVLLDRYMAFDQ